MKRVVMTPLRDMAYTSGYCMLKRGGVIEIWHYASDQFKRTEPTWKDAFDWAMRHSTIARLPKKLWPSKFYGEDAPICWTDWPEVD